MILPALFLSIILVSCGGGGDDPKPVVADRFVGTWAVTKATLNGADVLSQFSGVSISFTKSGDANGSYTAQVSGSALNLIGGNGTWSTNPSATQLTLSGGTYTISVVNNVLTLTFTDTSEKDEPTYILEFTK